MDVVTVPEGAWDLHCHRYPEVSLEHRARTEDETLVDLAEQAGMAGVLLKSHFRPTPERAYSVQRRAPGVRLISSITLNPVVGGISPLAVEAAVRLGAKSVFFPTGGRATTMRMAASAGRSDGF